MHYFAYALGRFGRWRVVASVALLLCGLLVACAATAVELPIAILGRGVGLDKQNIGVLYQDRDGFVWAGTSAGLYVFDGVDFLRMDAAEGFQPSAVVDMVEDDDGDLWVATQAGMQMRQHGHFVTIAPMRQALVADRGQTLALQASGNLLVVRHHRLLVVTKQTDRGWTAQSFFSPQQRQQDPMLDQVGIVAEQPDATWFSCGTELCRFKHGKIGHFGPREGVPADAWQDILPARDGSIWVQGRQQLLRLLPGAANFVKQQLPSGQEWLAGASGLLAQDTHDHIVVGTNTGLLRLEGRHWKVYGDRQGLMPEPIRPVSTVLADRDGSLWMGNPGSGVLHWAMSKRVETWSAWLGWNRPEFAKLDRINAFTLWTPDDSRLLSSAGDQTERRWPLTTMPAGSAHIVRHSRDGSTWSFHFDRQIMRRLPGANRFTTVAVLKNYIRGVLTGRDGRFWIYTRGGVDTLDPKTLVLKHAGQFQYGTSCTDAAEDPVGHIWAACSTGLYRHDRQWVKVKLFMAGSTVARQTTPITPERIAITSDGRLWLSTTDARLLVSQTSISDELSMQPTDAIMHDGAPLDFLKIDQRGWLWAGSCMGVDVFDGRHWSRLTSRDGLLLDETGSISFHADDDGSVWIASKMGLSHLLDPARLLSSPVWQAKVIAADYSGRDLLSYPTAPFDQGKILTLHLAVSGNSTGSPVRYRYRLEGIGEGWRETSDRSVDYPLAAPGTYRFEVRAVDVNHEHTLAPVTWTFTLTVPWWRSPWMALLTLPLLIAGIALAWRWRSANLIAKNRQLERTVDRRTAQLTLALRARNDLLARISHDLRSPLGNIIECVNQWRDGGTRRDYPRIIEQSIWQQIGLIDDLLEFAQGERTETELEETAGYLHAFLAEIASQAALLAERSANQFVHRFDANLPLLVKADFRRLRQVLLNLLGNAAKFTHDGLVEFEVAAGMGDTGHIRLRFTIRDNGIGIGVDKLESLVEPFVRGSNVEQREGKGLGLSIVAYWLDRMHSELHSRRLDSGGSEFFFAVDFGTASESEVGSSLLDDDPMETNLDGCGQAIVVVDDQSQNRDLLCDLLDSYGFRSFPAASGEEALRIVEAQGPVMVITDNYMDGMGGLALLEKLRETHANLPVVLCSAALPMHSEASGTELSFDAVLLKPVSVRQLLQVVGGQLMWCLKNGSS
ncbi:MAG TPA: two-component regulator propeller domain-containing protein [Rhodanobacter sp.]|nr:two-component regulator propeller domain-containing protein [Rhodanobacter sp.]